MRQCPKCAKRFLSDDVTICDDDGALLQTVLVSTGRDRLVHTVIGNRYEITGVLGDGGMGVVYRARGLADGTTYAIKVLRAEYSTEEDLVNRFQQEAEAVAKIHHPNIVRVYEFGALPDQSRYFVMEYLSGQSLGQLLVAQGKMGADRFRPLPEALTIDIARQICAGLGAAHALGIVHRDMKPDNVHLTPRGEDSFDVKVLDFGIAKVQGSQSARTRTGSVFGTPHYMSPEQAQGERDIDPRTDIYALGVLLYQMSTGRVPFDADNLMGILTQHLYHYPPAPTELNEPGQTSLGLESVILKALSKSRDGRYATMAEFDADLARAERGEMTEAQRECDDDEDTARGPDHEAPAWRVSDVGRDKATVPAGRITNTSKRMKAATPENIAASQGATAVPIGTGQSIPPVTATTERARSRASVFVAAAGLVAALGGGAAFWGLHRAAGTPAATGMRAPVVSRAASEATPVVIPVPTPTPVVVTQAVADRPSPTIHVLTDPPGGEISDGTHALGHAPIDLPRPAAGTEAHYTFSAPGRLPVDVVVRADTPRALEVPLPERPAAPATGGHSHGPRRHGELLDPWNN